MKNTPIRMCINCRVRLPQQDLIRLSCDDRVLKIYIGSGRSFYICKECIKLEDKILKRAFSRACKKEIKINDLEKILNG